MNSHNLHSVPSQARVFYDWSDDFQHACIHWQGHDVADLIHIFPVWYLITNNTFIAFRDDGAARSHVQKTIDRVEQRLQLERQIAKLQFHTEVVTYPGNDPEVAHLLKSRIA